jgi:hypothetical protein
MMGCIYVQPGTAHFHAIQMEMFHSKSGFYAQEMLVRRGERTEVVDDRAYFEKSPCSTAVINPSALFALWE